MIIITNRNKSHYGHRCAIIILNSRIYIPCVNGKCVTIVDKFNFASCNLIQYLGDDKIVLPLFFNLHLLSILQVAGTN